ncbi:MAG: aromatic aminobenezylarsenical efflux permease ArsG family transporter [Bacteroidales bacterium]|nr:aromatic aminobenezylarsenical efflux permease ArsG family transporter [Bacteroidales bacterium]MCF8343853.1 aromatic aminobenezylarsenical efflux permease ArsG family transporter [Bacteroidales bacterium]MCF8349577.1 aromatic aminobenezylarsenical efflux permease ArsG family transporter [Bacteroidales bacterium]MCF8375136.1 aromatic aminobenezylarsenical efflux permease ArsG family transporter [Bacteroidales bacterium]MCF8400043.1 aromatic aminobenezylarsenical efflux permease ArsG family t
MEAFLQNLMSNSSSPVVTAFILGLMTAISPCPMATNITAIGFISKDVEDKRRVFMNGLIYTAGRAIAYTLLAVVIFIGADQFEISGWFQKYGEKIIGPLLIIIGLFMLDILKIKFPGLGNLSKKFQNKTKHTYWDVLILGVIFALAFCPYSGVLYFGILIPITVSSTSGLYLPVVFAIATGIPVIIFAWLIAYTVSGVGKVYNSLKTFEIWFRRVIAMVFIGVGVYYVIVIYL